MSDSAPTPAAENAPAKRAGGQIFVDLGPVIIFMLTYNLARGRVPAGEEIYLATGVFIAATIAAIGYAWFKQKRLPPMLIVTAVVVLVFGGLTLALHDPVFIKMKPTIVNALFGAVLLGGLAFGKSLLAYVFDAAFHLTGEGWKKLTLRWGLFFLALAALNEIVWRSFPTDTWVAFKVWGIMPITIAFTLSQMPLITRHSAEEKQD